MVAKRLIYLSLIFLSTIQAKVFAGVSPPVAFNALFSEIHSDHPTCDHVFAKQSYAVDFHILNQPRGAVIHFKDRDGFFGGSNLVASRGYDDLFLEKTVTREGWPGVRFAIQADGIYDSQLVLLDFTVTARQGASADAPVLCVTTGQFYGSGQP